MRRHLLPLAAACLVAAPAAAQEAERPALVVTIVVDQLGSNLFEQYRPQFTGGLRRLSDEGLVYPNGYQAHAVTTTCPGHAAISTGRYPTHTGVPTNGWVDPATGEEVYCLADRRNALAHGRNTDNGPVGPVLMTASAFSDWLKADSPRSRVFGVSGKDRGAITLAGHHGDGAFWLTDGFGLTTFVEPGQSAEARLAPVAAFNASLRARFAAEPPAWTYRHEQCRRLEGDWQVRGQAYRAAVPPMAFKMDVSPILDELTLEAAAMLLDSQRLGRRGVTDFLGVSLSGTDRIGHGYGTQGPEMCEQLLRLDTALGAFLDKLATLPGVLVVLSADHGGSDMPERMAARGAPAARDDGGALKRVNARLRQDLGLEFDPLRPGGSGLVIGGADRRPLEPALRARVLAAALPLLNAEPDVALALDRDRVLAEPMPVEQNPEELTLHERMRLSAVPGRSPDILVAQRWGLSGGGLIGGSLSGHGAPWDYDRRVPIVFWRPGQQGQERFWPVRTVDIAPTLADWIGVEAPADVDGRVLSARP